MNNSEEVEMVCLEEPLFSKWDLGEMSDMTQFRKNGTASGTELVAFTTGVFKLKQRTAPANQYFNVTYQKGINCLLKMAEHIKRGGSDLSVYKREEMGLTLISQAPAQQILRRIVAMTSDELKVFTTRDGNSYCSGLL